MAIKIVADSSANVRKLDKVPFTSVPLTINTSTKIYVDDENLNVHNMLKALEKISDKTSTACPGPGDWMESFEDYDEIIAIPLTSKISGGYNSCVVAAEMYTDDNPNRKVHVMDTLTTGPEMELLIEKAEELISAGQPFEMIKDKMDDYLKHTNLAFSLESLQNFVRNGRVNQVVALAVDILNIRIVGKASDSGELEPLNKCRGEKNAIAQIVKNMEKAGFRGGKARIRHTENPEGAEKLKRAILIKFPSADVKVADNKGLCAYYAEKGGLLVGFES